MSCPTCSGMTFRPRCPCRSQTVHGTGPDSIPPPPVHTGGDTALHNPQPGQEVLMLLNIKLDHRHAELHWKAWVPQTAQRGLKCF